MSGTTEDLEKRELPEFTSSDQHPPSGNQDETAAVVAEFSGTFHQSKVKPRKGFLKSLFLPQDKEYMNAVNRDAAGVVYEDGGEEERKIKRTIDNRILPFLVLSFICELSFRES